MALSSETHGVIVTHGVLDVSIKGDLLASFTNSIANALEQPTTEGKQKIHREMDTKVDPSVAKLHIEAPNGTKSTWVFKEAYWVDAFPAPSASMVLGWVVSHMRQFLVFIWEKWFLTDPANNKSFDPKGGRSDDIYNAGPWHSILFGVLLFFLRAMLIPMVVIAPVLLITVRILHLLPRFGAITTVINWVHALDPMLSRVLGDVKRYAEHGMWSANARGILEQIVIDMLNDDGIEDITIVAHSLGAVVTYDALKEGGRIAQVVKQRDADGKHKKISFISVGSAINPVYRLTTKSKDPLIRERFSTTLSGVITGNDGSTNKDDQSALQRFTWLDIFARLDPIAFGRMDEEKIAKIANIDSSQLKSRMVVNKDNPIEDHVTYWQNKALVMPRIIKVINGNQEYPWEEAGFTKKKFKNHFEHVTKRLGLIVIGIGVVITALTLGIIYLI